MSKRILTGVLLSLIPFLAGAASEGEAARLVAEMGRTIEIYNDLTKYVDVDGTNNRFTNHIFPLEKDNQSNLISVKDAYILLSDYVGCFTELIGMNRHCGRLKSR